MFSKDKPVSNVSILPSPVIDAHGTIFPDFGAVPTAKENSAIPEALSPIDIPKYNESDESIGKSTNIGAGTITCNYDGVKKSKTLIKDNVFIGSNSSLVAPVKIEKNSVVGAGSVITKNVKKKSLALTRSKQVEIKNYKRKK